MKMSEINRVIAAASLILVQGCSTGARKPADAQTQTGTPSTNSSTPAFTVTDGMLSGRLFAALALVKDPAVTTTNDGHVVMSAAGQSIDCFNGIVKDAGGGNEQLNTCSFNLQASPLNSLQPPLSALLYQALSLYANQPKSVSDPYVIKDVQVAGSKYGIKAQTGMELAFPATIPQAISCNSLLPYGMSQPMYDCSLNIYELLSATDTQTLYQELKKDPGYSKIIKDVKRQAKESGFPNNKTRAWKSLGGEVKTVTTFTQAGPIQMGRIPNSITMVINGEINATPAGVRVTGVYYGMD
jgi:hypothetical protein